MGGRSSPAIFNSVSDAVEWICINNYNIDYLIHLLDDFFTVQEPEIAPRVLQTILNVFSKLGIPVNSKKVEGPATCIEFLGITLDTINMEARLSKEKISKLHTDVTLFLNRKKCTQRELLSIIGSLSFACKVITPGRSFLSRLISKAYSVRELHFKVRLSKADQRDFKLWNFFLSSWNGKNLFLFQEQPLSDFEFCTDAAGTLGFGGFYKRQWFSEAWKPHQLAWSMPAKELYPIVVAAQLWGHLWTTKRIIVNCDNISTVGAINRGYSNKNVISDLIRVLVYLSMHYNFHIRASYIPGKENSISDALSRLQVNKFMALAPGMTANGRCIPLDPLSICEEVFNA
jgi:hypothetical protein